MAKIRLMKSDELEKTLQELYEDFQLQKFIRNDNTIYEQSLVHFFRFMKKIGVEFVRGIEKKSLDKFVMSLKKKGLKANH